MRLPQEGSSIHAQNCARYVPQAHHVAAPIQVVINRVLLVGPQFSEELFERKLFAADAEGNLLFSP